MNFNLSRNFTWFTIWPIITFNTIINKVDVSVFQQHADGLCQPRDVEVRKFV